MLWFFSWQLDYKVSDRKLRDIFKMAGNVVSCELKVDKEGKSRGMGIVRFEHAMEAVQAICILAGSLRLLADLLKDFTCSLC